MTRTPPWWVRRGVVLVAHVLPRGPVRDRYQQEFLADLYVLSRRQAARYLLDAALHVRRLRAAVVSPVQVTGEATTRATVPLACRWDLRHAWHLCHTEDGGIYKECARCHKEHPEWRYYLWRYPGDNVRGSFGA